MNKWKIVILLSFAQFVMVLDSTVMNVSISQVVSDLNTTVASMQAAITFYTLTMAAFMLLGAKLGEVWGKKKAFIIGCIIYAIGSFITSISPNVVVLFFGWSIIEGLGAVLVIPAITALVADNYRGNDRIKAYALIGAVSGAAMAAGPLIGGFMTTYLSWRYVFLGETLIIAGILFYRAILKESGKLVKIPIDKLSVFLSAVGLTTLVYGILQSKTWGWIRPLDAPEINGEPFTPLGISLVAYLILIGIIILKLFFARQRSLKKQGIQPLLDVDLFGMLPLKSGLLVLMSQYAMIAGIFFILPIYLQMSLGYDALETGLKIFPLSVALIAFSVIGTRMSGKYSPRRIVRVAQVVLILSSFLLLSSVSAELKGWLFAFSMVCVGAALGLLASQLGTVNMASVEKDQTSAVGGMQGVFQNLGSSFGTAIVGSFMIASLTLGFTDNVQSSTLPESTKATVEAKSQDGVPIVSKSEVSGIAQDRGLPEGEANELSSIYGDTQIDSLRTSIYVLIFIATGSLLFSGNIPNKKLS